MKKLQIIILTLILALFILISCGKTGKTITVVALPKHNTTAIFGATAYVFNGATTQPTNPTANFDLKVVGEENENHVHLENMKKDDYYIYITGYDSIAAVAISGGIHLKLNPNSINSTEFDLEIPVVN